MKIKLFFLIFFIYFVNNLNYLYSLSIYDISSIISNNSLNLQKKKLDLQSYKLNIDNQLFEYFPSLDAIYNANLYKIGFDNKILQSIKIFSEWSIINNFERYINHKIQYLEYTNLLLDYEISYKNEILDAILEYINVLKNKVYYELSISNISIAEYQLYYVKSLKEKGKASELDILNSTLEYDNAVYNSKYYQIQYENSLLKLEKLLNIKITNSINDCYIDDLEKINLLEYFKNIEYYINNNPKILIIKNNYNILKWKEFSAFKNRWLPSLSINAGIDWGEFNYNSVVGIWTNNYINANIGININFPIFENNTKSINLEKLQLSLKNNDLELKDKYNTINLEIKELIDNYNNKYALFLIALKRYQSSKINKEKVEESYKLGIKSLLDYYNADKNYKDAERDLIFTKYELIILLVKLGNYFGDPYLFIK